MPRIACRICRRTFHISCSLALSRKRVSPNFISTPTKFQTLRPLSPSRYHTYCVQFNARIHGRERGRRKGGEERTRTVSQTSAFASVGSRGRGRWKTEGARSKGTRFGESGRRREERVPSSAFAETRVGVSHPPRPFDDSGGRLARLWTSGVDKAG